MVVIVICPQCTTDTMDKASVICYIGVDGVGKQRAKLRLRGAALTDRGHDAESTSQEITATPFRIRLKGRYAAHLQL